MRRAITWLPWILLITVIGFFFAWQLHWKTAKSTASNLPPEKQKALLLAAPRGGVVSYNEAVRVAAPAVVNIYTKQKVKVHPQLEDPILRKFFERQFPSTTPQHENDS